MTEVIAGALWAAVAGSLVAVLLATIVGTFVRLQRPAAATRCTLWLIVLSTCILAPTAIFGAMNLPSVRTSAPFDRVTAQMRGARGDLGAPVLVRGSAFAPRTLLQRPALPGNVARAIAALWLGGALIGCAGLLRSIVRVRALKRRSSPLDGSLADDLPWLTQTQRRREIYLRLSYEIELPIAIGFRRPVILIPTEMATLAGLAAIEPLVMHEYAHLARYDDWTNLLQRVVERLAWCNPLVWYAGRRLGLEREVAADDAVVYRTRDAARYASTLWRLAREMRMPEHVVVAPGAMLTRKQISIRIERLLDDSRSPHRYVGAGLAVATFAACTVTAVAASAPRFEAHSLNAQLLFLPTLPFVAPSRAIETPSRVRKLADDAGASAASRLAHQTAEHAPVRATPPALAKLVSQTVASTLPVKAASPAPDDVRGETLGPYHGGCLGCNLQDADLHGQDFRRARFQGANMQNADLHDAKLNNAVLIGVNLENANLDGADLRGAQLTGTNLQGASMHRTLTTGISLIGTSLP